MLNFRCMYSQVANFSRPGTMYYTFQMTNKKGAVQSAPMHRLICAFFHMQQNQVFSLRVSNRGHLVIGKIKI